MSDFDWTKCEWDGEDLVIWCEYGPPHPKRWEYRVLNPRFSDETKDSPSDERDFDFSDGSMGPIVREFDFENGRWKNPDPDLYDDIFWESILCNLAAILEERINEPYR